MCTYRSHVRDWGLFCILTVLTLFKTSTLVSSSPVRNHHPELRLPGWIMSEEVDTTSFEVPDDYVVIFEGRLADLKKIASIIPERGFFKEVFESHLPNPGSRRITTTAVRKHHVKRGLGRGRGRSRGFARVTCHRTANGRCRVTSCPFHVPLDQLGSKFGCKTRKYYKKQV